MTRLARNLRTLRALILGLLVIAGAASAQDLTALARLDPQRSQINAQRTSLTVTLALSQPVPWRIRVLADPPRLLIDTREVQWQGYRDIPVTGQGVTSLRAGPIRSGWSRLVIELPGPMIVQSAEMQTANGAAIVAGLTTATPETFTAQAARPDPPEWDLPVPADLPATRAPGGPLVVVLDPGHGGLDPGAERDGITEAEMMLGFALELKDVLLRDERFLVVMTREEDAFVPLETRISIARAAGAHAFLSLHADAIAEGRATGTTIYTLDEQATDEAGAALAERHRRDDLLSGIDLTGQDDQIAAVLMDMARTETEPRIERLALALEGSIKQAGIRMHRRPRQAAAFSVLKSPDIPSVLIELGFLSSASDMDRLQDPAWRATMAEALRDGLLSWAGDEGLTLTSSGE